MNPPLGLPRTLILTGFAGFLLMGGAQALYGPLYLAWRSSFTLGAEVSFVTSLHFFGAFAAILTGGWVMQRFSVRVLLVLANALLATGCLIAGLAPAWAVVLVGAALIGLGYGGLTVGLNTLFAAGFGEARSAMMVNLLNAFWGFGSILGPLLVSRAPADTRTPFLLCAILVALLVPLAAQAQVKSAQPEATGQSTPALPWLLILAFAGLCFLYTGLEVGTGSFETTHLRLGFGFSESDAARWNALFWLGMTLGRVLVVPFSLRLTPAMIVIGSSIGASLSLIFAHMPAVAGVAYALCGVFCGPLFPTTFVWAGRSLGNSPTANSLVISGGSLGAVILPPLVGYITSSNATWIPSVLLGIGVLHITLSTILGRTTHDRS